MKLRIKISLFILIIPVLTHGNNDSLFVNRDGGFVLTPNVLFQNLDLTINGAHGSIVSFEPGKTVALGGTLSYKGLVGSIYYSVYNEFQGELESKSEYLDFRFNFTRRRGGLDLYFQKYNGFSIKELPTDANGALVNLANPNIDLITGGFNIYYSLNQAHSVQSVYKYNELQTRSSGSLQLGLSQNYTRIRFTNSIFPDDIIAQDQMLGENNDGKFIALIPTIGYQYNLIQNKFNVSPTATAGIGIQYQEYISAAKGNFQGVNAAVRIGGNLPVGINNEKNYYGIIGRYDKSIFFLEKGIEIHYDLFSIKAYFGIRF